MTAQIKRLEVEDVEKTHLQQVFLDAFLEYCKFSAACNVLQKELDKGEGKAPRAQMVAGAWLVDDAEFKASYERANKIVDNVYAAKMKEFLFAVGSGEQKTGKEYGITDCSVKASHMGLEYHDRPNWSSKAPVEKGKGRKILVGKSRIADENDANSDN
jgi:hypothetical protein